VCFLFNNYSPRAGLTSSEELPFALGVTWVDPGSAPSPTWNLRRLLPFSEAREFDSFQMFVKGDEGWLVLEHQRSTKWSVVRDKIPARLSQMVGREKVMFTVIWGTDDSTLSI
jgi:hypothetical protein